MMSPTKSSRHSQHLITSYHNNRSSYSSITTQSDTGTFHSALAHPSHMEMRPMSQQNHKPTRTVKRPTSPLIPAPLPSPKLEAVKMNRQDSGFSAGSSNSPRNSTSSSRRPSPSKREKEGKDGKDGKDGKEGLKRRNTSGSHPSGKRSSKSSSTSAPRTSTSSNRRPNLQSRHTTPYNNIQQTYEYFHFPSLSDPEPSDPSTQTQLLSPAVREDKIIPAPPTTIQYWTSDSTRRLEYAAIDAASRGVRGFFIKLVPDCILPQSSRRPRFSEGDDGDDVGSVRRYRLELPDEKTAHARPSRGGLWRRFSWGRSRSC